MAAVADAIDKRKLIDAVRAGDNAVVSRLLLAGADPNARDKRGLSALRCAVDGGRLDVAAQLLIHGADHAVADADGLTPLDPQCIERESLHRLRQLHRRSEWPPAADTDAGDTPGDPLLDRLRADGMAKWPGLVEPGVVHRMASALSRFVGLLDAQRARGRGGKRHYDERWHYWTGEAAYVCNDAFRFCPELVALACDSRITRLARAYYGKPIQVKRAIAIRYLAAESSEADMFRWHHDMEDKLFKVLVLLTDVGDSDQYMTYAQGSHRLLRPMEAFHVNEADIDGHAVIRATGRAGDAFVFDANGAHRANRRSDGAVRDVFILEYACDESDIAGGYLPPAVRRRAWLDRSHPLSAIARVRPQWRTAPYRRHPTWIENLPFSGTWITPAVTPPAAEGRLLLIYLLHADGLDDGWIDRFSRSVASARAQADGSRFDIRVADYSRRPVRDEIATLLGNDDYVHFSLDGEFNHAFCRNHAAKQFASSARYLVLADIDVLFPPNLASRWIRRYVSSGAPCCVTAPIWYLDADVSRRIDGYVDPLSPDVTHWRVFPGGAALYARALYEQLKGFDEAYEGWGAEDEDFYERAAAVSAMVVDRDVRLLHLDHPRRETRDVAPRDENRRRLERKRRGDIPWCGWSRWGEFAALPPTAGRFPRHAVVRPRGFGPPRAVDDGYVVGPDAAAFRLNPSAALVYSLCDGGRTVGGIIDAVQSQSGLASDVLSVDVRDAIEQFVRIGIVAVD